MGVSRCGWVVAGMFAGFGTPACGPAVVPLPAEGGNGSESSANTGTAAGDHSTTCGTGCGDGSDRETAGAETVASGTSEPMPPDTLGCEPPLACDKAAFEGSATVATAQDAAEIAGHTSITGSLTISNPSFECLTFLACMEYVGHDLTVSGNDSLSDVTGLDGIAEIGATPDGPLGPGGTLTISENPRLVDFDTLNLLEQTPASLRVEENASLEAINGLRGMVGTQDDLIIRSNPNLSEVSPQGLPEVLFVGGECLVTDNEGLSPEIVESICPDDCGMGPVPKC